MITDELRKYVNQTPVPKSRTLMEARDRFNAIADRIDAEHEKALDELKAKHGQMWLKGYAECHAELLDGNETLAADLEGCGWVRLPVDADGVPIRVGDEVEEVDCDSHGKVYELRMDENEWWVIAEGICRRPHRYRHHKPPTVEDVLEEMYDALEDARIPNGSEKRTYEQIIAEYAAKLQLREEGE